MDSKVSLRMTNAHLSISRNKEPVLRNRISDRMRLQSSLEIGKFESFKEEEPKKYFCEYLKIISHKNVMESQW